MNIIIGPPGIPEVAALVKLLNGKKNPDFQKEFDDLIAGKPIYNSFPEKLTNIKYGLVNVYFDSVTQGINLVLRTFAVNVKEIKPTQNRFLYEYELTLIEEIDKNNLQYFDHLSLSSPWKYFVIKDYKKL
jgi:hypothetical protein